MLLGPIRSFEVADDSLPPMVGSARPYGAINLTWKSQGASAYAASSQAEGSDSDRYLIEYRCALVVLGDNDAEVARLDVSFSERVMTASRSRLSGRDASESLLLDIEADLPPSSVRLQFRFHPDASARPDELLPVIGVMEALREGRRLGLWSYSTGRWAANPVTIPADHPALPDGYASTVELLARIQQRTQQPFPMPAELNDADADAMRRADALLSGDSVHGRWQNATLVLDQEGLALIGSATGAFGARLDFTSEYAVDIAGHTVVLGPTEHRLFQVFLESTGPGSEPGVVEARLRSGDIDRFEIHLLGARRLDGNGAGGGGSALDRYAGQWIAQVGNDIVAVAATAQDVAAELRKTGRRAAIWRVPLNREEAEAAIGG